MSLIGRKRRVPHIRWVAVALVLSLVSFWESVPGRSTVSTRLFRRLEPGFFIEIDGGDPPGWLCDLMPADWWRSMSAEWSDAFGRVKSITGGGDPGKEFTDGDLPTCSHCRALRVDLGHSLITDAGLVQLEQVPELKYLLLDNTQIGDAGVAHLRNLTNLKVLHLGNTRITDAALLQLEEMEDLRKLSVQKTRVTKDGVARLRKALPDLSQVITILEGVE